MTFFPPLFSLLFHMQSVMPEGALVGAWIKSAHKLWIKRLRRTSTLAEFLQVSNFVFVSFYFVLFTFPNIVGVF